MRRIAAIEFTHALQNFAKGWLAAFLDRREIGAAPERLSARREKHRERPTRAFTHRLQRAHVDCIDVGPLFSIDLDVDEMSIHERGRVGILEALACHDVAPVTGCIADAEEDRLRFPLSERESRVAPREPLHGIRAVLPQVRALFVRECVHHPGRACAACAGSARGRRGRRAAGGSWTPALAARARLSRARAVALPR